MKRPGKLPGLFVSMPALADYDARTVVMVALLVPAVVMAAIPVTMLTDHDALARVMAVMIAVADTNTDRLRKRRGGGDNGRGGGNNKSKLPHLNSPTHSSPHARQ